MKKTIRLLLLAALCLCMAIPALADTGVELARDGLSDVRFAYGSSVLRYRGRDGYALMDLSGNLLTQELYSDLSGEKCYIAAESVNGGANNAGLLDAAGNTLIPCQYGDLRVESYEWALGVVLADADSSNYDYKNYSGDQFYLIQTVDVYHLPEGRLLATLTRDQFLDADVVNHCLNIQDRSNSVISCYDANFNQVGTNLSSLYDDDYAPADYTYWRENGQYGIQDAAGNVIMQPSFSYISDYKNGLFCVSTGDFYGLVDLSGNVVVPAVYDRIRSSYYGPVNEYGIQNAYACHGYVCVEKDGKIGYVDLYGNETCPPKYAEKAFDTVTSCAGLLIDLSGNRILVAADGVETTLPAYDSVYALDYTGGMLWRVRGSDGTGVIDWHGNEIVPPTNSDVDASANGEFLLVDVDYDNQQLYTISYDEATPAVMPAAAEGGDVQAAPTGDNAAVITLLNNAVTLLNTDASGNSAAISSLLSSASLLLSGNDAAASLLNSAATLATADAGTNAASIATILNSVISMLQ